MVYKIIWTEQVRDQLRKVKDYLSDEWSIKIAEDFVKDFNERIELLKSHPETGFRSWKYDNVRRIPITKHNLLYYLVEKDNLILLDLFDTRQDPEKNLYQ